jgi:hypothetical protein
MAGVKRSRLEVGAADEALQDPSPAHLDALRALVLAFTNRGTPTPAPTSTIAIANEMRRRNQSTTVTDGLGLLYLVRDVQRFPRGFWLPTPTRLVRCQHFSLVVSCLPTQELTEELGYRFLAHGASRVYAEDDPLDRSIPQIPYSEWLNAPDSTSDWAQRLIESITYLPPHGMEGMEFYRHWKSLNPRRWIAGNLKIPADIVLILARHRGVTGQTNHYLFRVNHGTLHRMAELPHEPDTILRLQFHLRAKSADNAMFEVEPTETESLVRLTTPVLPTAERRLLSALGNLTVDRNAGRCEGLLPAISLEQVAATLSTLGLRPRGSMT